MYDKEKEQIFSKICKHLSCSQFLFSVAVVIAAVTAHDGAHKRNLFFLLTGDSDAAGPEQQGAHHRCLSSWCHFILLPETCEWDEHRQRMSSLLSALQARRQELLHPRRHHLHQSNRGPHRPLSGSTWWYSLETRQLFDHYSFTLAQSWSF